ncbi:DUF505 domain-containing protein [Thermococcus sp. M39]|uniref:DUF505 family protein n=1 Tax=unclassified Thermococcus TaxID=2627626 RepID=UPI00143C9904|nr:MULTISPECIES: DUF505 family protein [unclassified Thermococcus]NJE08581.1 DUF505 domain-containing protein [Thermococcus sp. M39]NJE13188.1 DUF505 domain-containing protein [Thermococcus sp. LS2]
MFLKKRHLEIIKEMAKTESQAEIQEKLPEEFQIRALELYILGFAELEGNKIKFTEAGRKLLEISEKLNVDELPDIFVDSEIIKILELLEETGQVPEEWLALLKERKLADENGLTEVGKAVLELYKEAHPLVYLTPEIVSFLREMPKIGTLDELITYKNSRQYGDNIINALQAMRLLLISPQTEEGKAFATTPAAKLALRAIQMIPVFARAIVLRREDFEMLKAGKSTAQLRDMGLADEKGTTELGKAIMNTYEAMGRREEKVLPIYVLDDELAVLKAIQEIEGKYEKNPDILPTYKEIEKIAKVDDLGEILHLLESKELIRRELVKNKDTYWLTEWGREAIKFGTVSPDGMKAITYAESGDVPIAEWVIQAKKEGLIAYGITDKGRFYLKLSKSIKRKPYLTMYDSAILVKMPRKKYIHRDELVKLVQDYVGGDEKAIIKAIGEAEAKGFIVELQNKMVKLTELGEKVKTAVENAKVQEVIKTKFGVTPTTYNVLKVIYENLEVFNRIWKESKEIRGYKQDEVDVIKKHLSLSEDEIKKALTILRALGFLGEKSLTEAGRILVEAYA